jgi:hypothetical protein
MVAGALLAATTSHARRKRPGGWSPRVSVEASFFKRMSAKENLSDAARFCGLAANHSAPGARS